MNEELVLLKRSTARLSVVSNTSLVIFKLLVSWQTGAVSILSEAAHSAVDLVAALIAYFAVRKAAQPPDAPEPTMTTSRTTFSNCQCPCVSL